MKDQLRVFISSTIGECAVEREVAREAVKSIRHIPILFERLGATTAPPRRVYLRHLMEADIFIGIYRESYGWIDPRGDISGIHDEYNHRKDRTLPSLFYVLREAPRRDPRLAKLIDDAKPDYTLFFYNSPEELREQIAEDVTRLIAEGFEPTKLSTAPVTPTDAAPSQQKETTVDSLPATQTDTINLLRANQASIALEDLCLLLDEPLPAVLSALSALPELIAVRGNDVALLDSSDFENETSRQFYVHRLATHFIRKHRHLRAYELLLSIDHPLARTISFPAAMSAVEAGNVRAAQPILRQAMENARADGRLDEYATAALNLVRILMDAGDAAGAREVLNELRRLDVTDWELAIHEADLELDALVSARSQVLESLAELQAVYDREGDTDSAARVAITLSRLHINASHFDEAVLSAQFALRVFLEMGNRYGCATALTNLVAAQSGAGHDSSASEATLKEYANEPESSQRMESFRCNLGARRARQIGDNIRALKLSERAIELALALGDKRVELLNRINRGNALRGLARLPEALAEYQNVSADAARATMAVLEGDATRLAAGILNRQGEHGKALQHARHAIALLKETNATDSLMRATREEALALERSSELEHATRAYLTAAWLGRDNEDWTNAARNIVAAMRCSDAAGSWESFPSHLLSVFDAAAPDDFLSALMTLVGKLPAIWRQMPRQYSGNLSLRLFRLLFEKWSNPRHWQTIEPLIEALLKSHGRNAIHYVLALLAALPPEKLKLWEWVRAADLVSAASPHLTFKPHPDGSAHWTIVVDTPQQVFGTISAIDDTPMTSVVSLITACFLEVTGPQLLEALGVSHLPRNEFQILIGTSSSWLAVLPDSGVPASEPVGVSRAVDPTSTERSFLLVSIGEGFSAMNGHVMQLGGVLLYELARHFLRDGVNETALRRWIPPLAQGAMF